MSLRPLHDRVIIERLDEGEQQIGGIIIPDTAKEKPQRGKVIAAGNGKPKGDGKRVPLDVKAGDFILFGKYSGQEIKLHGHEYLIMKEEEILAIIQGGTADTGAAARPATPGKGAVGKSKAAAGPAAVSKGRGHRPAARTPGRTSRSIKKKKR